MLVRSGILEDLEGLFEFRPLNFTLFTSETCRAVVEALESGDETVSFSPDLGHSPPKTFRLFNRRLVVDEGEIDATLLQSIISDERSIYYVEGNELKRAEVRGDHYYKLVKTSFGYAPTVEIDGIHMHRVSGVTPEEDASMKVSLIRSVRGRTVLDTCTGLGYTAIASLRRGASLIITVERDRNVIELARLNPWSRRLRESAVKTILNDVRDVVSRLSDNVIDVVIHDPPTISVAGDLYSASFYRELARVMVRGGEMVHYVGLPGARTGKSIYKGVMERLRNSGFSVRWCSRERSVYARKL
ncbi:MAG: RsmD family RNA methyltransferase [Aigarchaeota archaeon]|nr:RsmD family RNA methyltransferase [Aigarchaeota archaeon]MDW8092920.1 RsmD family RNA methyltransferase [Nitrososphaerota archaeon]